MMSESEEFSSVSVEKIDYTLSYVWHFSNDKHSIFDVDIVPI